jgi:hypothetical protein
MFRIDTTPAARPSFEPGDAKFNRANALYLAHASDIVYHRAPAVAAEQRLGLQAQAFHNKVTRTRGFLGVCDTHAVLAFRGTNPLTIPNWLTVAVVRLVESLEYDGRVHYGFNSALRSTWAQVESLLDAVGDRPLFLTGHSMGGALSVLAALRLARAGRPPTAVYTFGAPRVGDAGFCAGYGLPTYRVVNRLDLVPELPLASAKHLLPIALRVKNEDLRSRLVRVAEQMPCYGHVSTLVYIDRDGSITPNADIVPWHVEAVARAVATRGKSFLEGITDHLIGNYIRALDAQSAETEIGVRRQTRSE